MHFKKILIGLIISGTLISTLPVSANGILDEDKEVICDTVQTLTRERPEGGYCQYIYSSPIGEPLLKEGLKYSLELGKYELAKHIIKVFGELNIDINDVDGLDNLVVRTGNKEIYESLVEVGYDASITDDVVELNRLLYDAIESGNAELVEKILNKGIDTNVLCDGFYDCYPLHWCLYKIAFIADSNNGYGFEDSNHKHMVNDLIKIAKLLLDYGADPYLYVGKTGYEKTAIDLLEDLNPDYDKNCYDKIDFYSKNTIDFCRSIYSDLCGIIHTPSEKL